MYYLETIVETFGPHQFLQFSTNPAFDSLRGHPRYLALQAGYQAWAEARADE
jgi:hypothetical protein